MSATVGEIEVNLSSLEFEWKIPEFFRFEEKYKLLHSPEFEFFGGKWSMEFLTRCRGLSELYVENRECGSADCFANYTFGIKCSDGSIYKSASRIKKVKQWYNTGIRESLYLSDLQQEKSKIAPQNVLTVFCNLSVTQHYCENTTSDATTQTDISEGIINLEKNLKDLLTSGEDTDVVMKVEDKDFRAHRAILTARSTVFASMFRHDMKERGSGTVDITDCDPQTFAQFLAYVYTGKVDRLDSENVCQLYRVTDKYDIQDLKTECVEYMKENTSTDNFCDVITLALRHKELALIETATHFFLKNAKKIVITVKWFCFMKENPAEANELTIKMLNSVVPD